MSQLKLRPFGRVLPDRMAGSTILKVRGPKILRKNATISNPRDAGVKVVALFADISFRDLKFGTHSPRPYLKSFFRFFEKLT